MPMIGTVQPESANFVISLRVSIRTKTEILSMVRTANVQSVAMPVSTVSKLLQRKARMMLSSVKSAVIFVPMMKNHWYLSKEQGIRMRIVKMSASRPICVPYAGKRS